MKSKNKIRREVRVTDIPETVFTKLKTEASKNERTQNKQIIYILKKYYNE